MTSFAPTRQAAHARLAAVNPAAYARTRNALDGAVTRLSPYLTHGLLSLREVYDAVHARQPLDARHKFVFELGWRAFYRHQWSHHGAAIHQSLHDGPLPDHAYRMQIPADVLEARTGIPAIDLAVRELYATGYVHNHARMWLASYLVHLRKVHWHTGAQWMLGYLLDGDVASNHLSWQWVAGTGSSKPYLFNADNVARFAPQQWHSPGTVIDTGYEALDRLARSTTAVGVGDDTAPSGAGIQPPDLRITPSGEGWGNPDASVATGRDVWLYHPWSIGAKRLPAIADGVAIAVGFAECHQPMPWSERRWCFVRDGLLEQTTHLWWGSVPQIADALRDARSVSWQPEPHANAALARLQELLRTAPVSPAILEQPQPCLFTPVADYCQSFSQWWRQTGIAVHSGD